MRECLSQRERDRTADSEMGRERKQASPPPAKQPGGRRGRREILGLESQEEQGHRLWVMSMSRPGLRGQISPTPASLVLPSCPLRAELSRRHVSGHDSGPALRLPCLLTSCCAACPAGLHGTFLQSGQHTGLLFQPTPKTRARMSVSEPDGAQDPGHGA